MKIRVFLVLMIFVCSNEIIAQKVKDEDVSFKYTRLPSNPINKKASANYKGEVQLAYEEADKAKVAEYEKKKADANEQYQKDKQAVDEKNAREQKEYKDKSFGKKLLDKAILEQDKPKEETVTKESVDKEFVHKVLDKGLLASTYIKLAGYEKSNNANLKITFIAYGIEWQAPNIKESSSTVMSGANAGQKKYEYVPEIKYRSPVAVKVETTDGNIILNETVEKTNEYLTWTGPKCDTRGVADANSQPEYKVAPLEQALIEANMKVANDYLNEKCATTIVERKSVLYNVESKKVDYSEFQQAYVSAFEGYAFLTENPAEAMTKLQASIGIWDKALKESDPKDKKARINEEITIATIFNLAEAYIWTNEYSKAKMVLVKASMLDLSKKESKKVEDLKLVISDQQQRFDANKSM